MSIKKKIKNSLFKILANLIKTDTAVQPIELRDIDKILIVRQDNRIGNILFTTSLIELIKQVTNISPDIVVGEKFHTLLEHNKNINQVYIYRQKQFARKPWMFFQFKRKLQLTRYDLVVDCKDRFSFNNAFITAMTNARCKIGFKNTYSDDYLNYSLELANNNIMHESVYLAQPFVRYFNLSDSIPSMRYDLYNSEAKVQNNVDAKIIGIHIGGRNGKSISPDLVNKITQKLDSENLTTLIIYGPDEFQKLKQISDTSNTVKFHPKSMRELSLIINTTDLFISPDTGPLHIASALDKSIIAVFNNDNSIRYGPMSSRQCLTINTDVDSQNQIVDSIDLLAARL